MSSAPPTTGRDLPPTATGRVLPPTATGRVLMEIFGCQMNVVDAELVLGRFRSRGYAETDSYDDADVVVFNTCSVRGHAEDKVYSRLGQLREWKTLREGRVPLDGRIHLPKAEPVKKPRVPDAAE